MTDYAWDLEKAARIIKGLIEALDKKQSQRGKFFFDAEEVKREIERGLWPGVGWVIEAFYAEQLIEKEMGRGSNPEWRGVYIISKKNLEKLRRGLRK